MAQRFVEIKASEILGTLRDIGEKIRKAGGTYNETTHGREVVVELGHHSGSPAIARIYTTLTHGASTLRKCDSDAIRIVIGATQGSDKFRPLGRSRKILRTAPQNIDDRVGAFLERFVEATRDAYKQIARVPLCPKCGAPMALREPKKGQDFAPFFGCMSYPACKETKSFKKSAV